MEATTQRPRRRAISTSARWPACRLPMVGTNAIEGSVASRLRTSATVWITFMSITGGEPQSFLKAVLRSGVAAVLDRLHVRLDRRLHGRGALHEVLHEACLAAGIDVEDVVYHEDLSRDVGPRADADGWHGDRL